MTGYEIETVARAMCKANGLNSDELTQKGDESWPLWFNYRDAARQHIAATDALKKVRL